MYGMWMLLFAGAAVGDSSASVAIPPDSTKSAWKFNTLEAGGRERRFDCERKGLEFRLWLLRYENIKAATVNAAVAMGWMLGGALANHLARKAWMAAGLVDLQRKRLRGSGPASPAGVNEGDAKSGSHALKKRAILALLALVVALLCHSLARAAFPRRENKLRDFSVPRYVGAPKAKRAPRKSDPTPTAVRAPLPGPTIDGADDALHQLVEDALRDEGWAPSVRQRLCEIERRLAQRLPSPGGEVSSSHTLCTSEVSPISSRRLSN